NAVAGVVDELQVLIHKAVFAIASGIAYDSSIPGSSGSRGFDVSSLLPARYTAGSLMNHVVDVAPIPAQLQARLEDAHDNGRDDDVLKVFSNEHIQKLYTAFLGLSRGASDVDMEQGSTKRRPFWEGIEKAIRHNSSVDQPGVAVAGLSRSLLECIPQLATNMKVLWSGAIYNKSLDYLLRILLRIHLAPRREERIQERARTFSRQHELEASGPPKLKMGQWRRRVLDLTDELADYVSDGLSRHRDRVIVVLDKLEAMEKIRPTPLQTGFDSIDVQYAKLVEETRTTDQPQTAVLGQNASSLDDDDDDDWQYGTW
ncbi:hypothetical protein BGZ65_012409, partial [Modicella reniformis]